MRRSTTLVTAVALSLALVVLTGPAAWAPHNSSSCGTINGTDGSETIWGTANCDDIFAKAGGDTIYGQEGNDDIRAAQGADKAWGGDGVDYIFGGAGNDQLNGRNGNDHVEDAHTSDTDLLCGGPGYDFVDTRDDDNEDNLYLDDNDTPAYDSLDHRWYQNCPF